MFVEHCCFFVFLISCAFVFLRECRAHRWITAFASSSPRNNKIVFKKKKQKKTGKYFSIHTVWHVRNDAPTWLTIFEPNEFPPMENLFEKSFHPRCDRSSSVVIFVWMGKTKEIQSIYKTKERKKKRIESKDGGMLFR